MVVLVVLVEPGFGHFFFFALGDGATEQRACIGSDVEAATLKGVLADELPEIPGDESIVEGNGMGDEDGATAELPEPSDVVGHGLARRGGVHAAGTPRILLRAPPGHGLRMLTGALEQFQIAGEGGDDGLVRGKGDRAEAKHGVMAGAGAVALDISGDIKFRARIHCFVLSCQAASRLAPY